MEAWVKAGCPASLIAAPERRSWRVTKATYFVGG